jgi:hypothetical protein
LFDDIRQATNSAMLNIFETMFFIFLEPLEGNSLSNQEATEPNLDSEEPPQPIHSGFLKSEIHFQGKYSGILRLLLPYDFSELLTANFMGFEEEVTEFQIVDMAGELANMICGNLFSVLDKTSVYVLGSPITQKLSFQDGAERRGPADLTMDFLAEDQQVTVQLHFDPVP